MTLGDGEVDNIPDGAINLSGGVGANSQWVVTEFDGTILGLPPTPYVVDFDGAGTGNCLVWYLGYDGEIEGLTAGSNTSGLSGCFDLSNPIEVIRNEAASEVDGGFLQTDALYLFCVGDEEPDFATGIELSGEAGSNSGWVVTDLRGEILGTPPTPDVVNFDVAGEGVCFIWHLSYDDIEGAVVGNNAFTDLSGCYELSNPIPVFRFSAGGTICELITFAREDNSVSDIKIYPNPAANKVTLDLSKLGTEDVTVEIYNFSSVRVYNKALNMRTLKEKSLDINVSDLDSGFYLVSVINNTTKDRTVKRLAID